VPPPQFQFLPMRRTKTPVRIKTIRITGKIIRKIAAIKIVTIRTVPRRARLKIGPNPKHKAHRSVLIRSIRRIKAIRSTRPVRKTAVPKIASRIITARAAQLKTSRNTTAIKTKRTPVMKIARHNRLNVIGKSLPKTPDISSGHKMHRDCVSNTGPNSGVWIATIDRV